MPKEIDTTAKVVTVMHVRQTSLRVKATDIWDKGTLLQHSYWITLTL